MASVPSVPLLHIRPVASKGALDFYWLAPFNNGGSFISCYTLLCSSITYSTTINAASTYCKVSGLNDNENYLFQLSATNAIGEGPYTPFMIAQPGILPGGPRNVTASTLNSTTANLVWSFSTNTNEGRNDYFVVTVTPLSTLSTYTISVYPDQRNQVISNLVPQNTYNFIVQSVSDAGWSYPNQSTFFTII